MGLGCVQEIKLRHSRGLKDYISLPGVQSLVLTLTLFVENAFDHKKKTSSAFVDLFADHEFLEERESCKLNCATLFHAPAFVFFFNSTLRNKMVQVYLDRKESF